MEKKTEEREKSVCVRARPCVCVCVRARARAYLDVAHLHCRPTLFEVHKVSGEGCAEGFAESSILLKHWWTLIMQIVHSIHDYFQLIKADTERKKDIKGRERRTHACLSPLKRGPTTYLVPLQMRW